MLFLLRFLSVCYCYKFRAGTTAHSTAHSSYELLDGCPQIPPLIVPTPPRLRHPPPWSPLSCGAPSQFKILLDYLYNKPISVPSSQIVELLSLTNRYQVMFCRVMSVTSCNVMRDSFDSRRFFPCVQDAHWN